MTEQMSQMFDAQYPRFLILARDTGNGSWRTMARCTSSELGRFELDMLVTLLADETVSALTVVSTATGDVTAHAMRRVQWYLAASARIDVAVTSARALTDR